MPETKPPTLSPTAEAIHLTHASDQAAPRQLDAVLRTLSTWHDENHPGPWRFCDQQPCNTIRRQTTEPPRSNAPWEGRR